ncbi:MAG: tetratricopeptide repeat protein [Myxococcota bacterium]|jgi:Flp pilus assembly protein TadD
MKKLIGACCAALALAACDEPRTSPTRTPAVVAMKVETPKPVTIDVPTPAVEVAKVDAGFVDPLVIAHDTPNVDHLARAKALASEGDVKGALTESRRALFSAPADPETLTVTAKLARRAGQTELAAEAWGRLAALQPDDATPLIQQARAQLAMKDHAGAVIAGREAIARDEGNPEAWQVTGLGQLGLGELSGAIASFKKVIDLDPNHGWALNNLGFAYLRANENDKAVEVLERAAELLPNVAFVHNNLGVALERTGRGEEAKTAYQRAMDLSPKYVKARINADRVAKAGVPQEAVEEPDTMSDVHPMPEP